ncbi:hypothetical protein ACQV5M_19520, partial [Leptospira sp. SA-E8]|uniref:hypothetical protein n=1 Tax=Leptospira sp. SA-E8 TaxID=3422259 RepID=UPI003EBA3B58
GGVDRGQAAVGKRRYLRALPPDPMAESGTMPDTHWRLRGYQDAADALTWNGRDVYDIHSQSPGTALDGTNYRDW